MVDFLCEVVGVVFKFLGVLYNINDFDVDVLGGREVVKECFFVL